MNYTSIADTMDPEEVHQLISACFQMLYDIVRRSDGTVTAFSGDGMMAIFGAPVAREDHGHRACFAALSMQEAMVRYAADVRERHGLDFSIRIGISSGNAIVGTMGHGYTALGDTVNVGARLQSIADPGTVVASRDTYALVNRFFAFEPLGPAIVKGKRRGIEAYRLLRATDTAAEVNGADERYPIPFLGRKRELQRLRLAFEKAQSATGQIVAVVGEAGIGKSRLLSHFRETTPLGDCLYLQGECIHFGSPIAYLPILGILRSLFTSPGPAGETVTKASVEKKFQDAGLDSAILAPVILDLFSAREADVAPSDVDHRRKREQIFEAVTELLLKESQEKTCLLVVENLSRIDRSSEAFLAYLAPRIVNARVLVVLLYRPEYHATIENQPHFVSLPLDGLDESEGMQLVKNTLEGRQVNDRIRSFIMGKAKGNPLFVEELTRTLKENGFIRESGGTYDLSSRLLDEVVPDTIQGIITARMDMLPSAARSLLQTSAVIGKTFSLPVLLGLVRKDQGLHTQLLELQAAQFILARTASGQPVYEFRHDLLREVAYNSLLLRKRRKIHESVGNAFEMIYSREIQDHYEILAHHFSRSDNVVKAYRYLKLAARKATMSSSLWEAFRYYKEALDLTGRAVSICTPDEELELRTSMVPVMISIGFPEDSLAILKSAENLARQLNSPGHVSTFSSVIGLYYSVHGELKEGRRYARQCFVRAEETGDITMLAPTAFDVCSNYTARGEFREARDVAENVIQRIKAEAKEKETFNRGYNVYSSLLAFQGFSEGYLGRFAEGEALCARSLQYSREIQNLYSLGMGETCYGYVLALKGNGTDALQHFSQAVRYLEKGNISVLLGLAWAGLGWAAHLAGDHESALSYIGKGQSIHRDAGIGYKSSTLYWLLSHVLTEQGKVHEAREYAERALREATERDETYVEGIARILIGATPEGADDREYGETQIRLGIEIVDELGILPFSAIGNLYLARLHRRAGNREMARETLSYARSIFEQTGMTIRLDRVNAEFVGV